MCCRVPDNEEQRTNMLPLQYFKGCCFEILNVGKVRSWDEIAYFENWNKTWLFLRVEKLEVLKGLNMCMDYVISSFCLLLLLFLKERN